MARKCQEMPDDLTPWGYRGCENVTEVLRVVGFALAEVFGTTIAG